MTFDIFLSIEHTARLIKRIRDEISEVLNQIVFGKTARSRKHPSIGVTRNSDKGRPPFIVKCQKTAGVVVHTFHWCWLVPDRRHIKTTIGKYGVL